MLLEEALKKRARITLSMDKDTLKALNDVVPKGARSRYCELALLKALREEANIDDRIAT